MGHYFRSLEICKALSTHDVIFVTGGTGISIPVPEHIRKIELPALSMDQDFGKLETDQQGRNIDDVKAARKIILYELFLSEQPDLFIVELFPFGRKAFGFELIPVLEGIRTGRLGPTRTVCSLRDVLVEKKDTKAYEQRVKKSLNQWFDAVLVHSDPSLIRLDETFSGISDIRIPVVYTGFITPIPSDNDRVAIRSNLGISENERLIVASAGGGRVGFELLEASMLAFDILSSEEDFYLHVFTGPLMEDDLVKQLQDMSSDRVFVSRFTKDFVACLAAADLSVSMAGYNTCMNIMAAGVPSLVFPFAQNQEQRLRAEKIAQMGGMIVIDDTDLDPVRLARLMKLVLSEKNRHFYPVDLNGALNTVNWITFSGSGKEPEKLGTEKFPWKISPHAR